MRLRTIGGGLLAAASILLSLSLSSCPNPSGSSGGAVPGFASGVITAKGSIFVNGVEYDTSSSVVLMDNLSSSSDQLQVGMLVDVKGSIDPDTGLGTADSIAYASSIEGTVDAGSVDAVAGTFRVFGLDILVDFATVFEGATGLSGTAPLAAGDRVEVSGLFNGTAVLASRVEVNLDSGDLRLWGSVGLISARTDGGFPLALEDGTSIAVTFTGTLEAGVVEGAFVKVEVADTYAGGALSTTASKIEAKFELAADDGDRVELSGIVAGLSGSDPVTFTVDGVSVSASAALAVGVVDGLEVEVKGDMAGGVLVASELSLSEDADLELKGVVTSPAPGAGTFLLNGVLVRVTHDTIMHDDLDIPVDLFGLADLAAADSVEVKAYVDDGGQVVAAKLERHETDAEAKLMGVVSAISGTTITVLGLPVDTTGLFVDAPTRDAFLASLVAGTSVVELTGVIAGTAVNWTTVELK